MLELACRMGVSGVRFLPLRRKGRADGEWELLQSKVSSQDYEAFHGVTFPGLYAMMAHAHMHKYGTTKRHLAEVAVKNHLHGSLNPLAQFRMKITADQVLAATMVADPLGLLDCSPVTDGAAAIIVTTPDMAKKLNKPLIQIKASAHATDMMALHARKDPASLPSVARAAEKAYQQSGLTPEDLDLIEVHDCFTIAELIITEELQIVERGKAGPAIKDGLTRYDGKIPVNMSGGLKSKGHPVGASGVAQVIELVEQLRGNAGDRQVKNAHLAMAQNMGGSGGSCVIHILEAKS
jgi:acetyl-CoA C-acetyltransferase